MNLRLLFSLIVLVAVSTAYAQPAPVQWKFKIDKSSTNKATLIATAFIQPGWHIYSQSMTDEGPLPTSFEFEVSPDYGFEGAMIENGTPFTFYDSLLCLEIKWLSVKATYTRKVRLHNPNATIKGKVIFMACNHETCLPPEERIFSVQAK